MSHALGDLGHVQLISLPQKAEEAVLGEGDVSAGELLGEVQDEAALEDGENIGEALGVGSQSGGFAHGSHEVKGIYGKGIEACVNRPECRRERLVSTRRDASVRAHGC